MLIGNRWVKNTRLKILNSDLILTAAWQTYPGALITNLTERGFLAAMFEFGQGATIQDTLLEMQIMFDGQAINQGFFRDMVDNNVATMSNIQPTTLTMPPIDIPEDTEVTVRARISNAKPSFVSFMDLYTVVYYIKDWDAAVPAVCFPTDVVAPGQV